MSKGLIKRSLVGALMVVILIGCMLTPYLFCLMIMFAIVIMMHEYFSMALKKNTYRIERFLAIFTVISAFLLEMLMLLGLIDSRWLLLLFLPFVAVLAVLLFDPVEQSAEGRKMEQILFPILYVGVPVVFLPQIMFTGEGTFTWHFFILTFVLIWMSDVGAYALGMAFGQKPNSRKLYPAVSPKKSWVGVWGGLLFTVLTAVALYLVKFEELSLAQYLAMAMIVVAFGITGDLFESLIKRHYGFKDSGTIMPGHGGLLDRFDSALFVFPAIVIFLKLCAIL